MISISAENCANPGRGHVSPFLVRTADGGSGKPNFDKFLKDVNEELCAH